MENIVQAVIIGFITGIFTSGTMLIVLKVEMKFLRRDVDHAHKRMDDHAEHYHHHSEGKTA